MTKLPGLETLFYGTAVVYAPESLRGFNWSIEGVVSILLILLTLLYICFFSTMIMWTPDLKLIVAFVVQPIRLHRGPGPLAHFSA